MSTSPTEAGYALGIPSDGGLLYLDDDAVRTACRDIDPVACVAQALACHATGAAEVAHEAVMRWEPPEGGMARTLNMPGRIDRPVPVFGTKIINASTANPSRGLPRAAGLTLLFDPVTAHPIVIMQAARISALRTAAVSTVAAIHLAAPGPHVAGVVGAGPIALAHIELLRKHLDVERVLISDLAQDRAAALALQLRRSGIEVEATPDAQSAVAPASIVVTATTTTTPYIRHEWLRAGALVVNVSLDDVEEAVYLNADRLYVDDWGLVVADSKRLLGKLARAGTISGPGESGGHRAVDGTLGELVTGQCAGREHDGQIILVNPFGMAIADLAIAARVHDVARLQGHGQALGA